MAKRLNEISYKKNKSEVIFVQAIGGLGSITNSLTPLLINRHPWLWNRLTRYIENGQVEIDNNLIENSIRPVALGRENQLFAGSHEVAHQAAMIYSFLCTCKIYNAKPFGWMKDVLSRIHDHTIQKLDELLPR